ncbi:hypothetical protein CDL15_Pgr009590 [Punica granatum]|uniref:Uncharacterized protein n=1 Tax=Punica granatum TaxID=22663 RepID=A0A218WT28_PUNGR|nr:hypothetical protein CDL15_Pgr009590 [Punica granatum]
MSSSKLHNLYQEKPCMSIRNAVQSMLVGAKDDQNKCKRLLEKAGMCRNMSNVYRL